MAKKSEVLFAVNLLLAILPLAIRSIVLGVMKGAQFSFESIFFTPDPFFFVAIYSSGSLFRIVALQRLDRLHWSQKLCCFGLLATALLGAVLYGLMLWASMTAALPGGNTGSNLEASRVGIMAAVLMGLSLVASLSELKKA